ncbi:phosphatidate phosphatase LPIN2 isoform X2 [Latimeria chalumnae]|uniref:phosphatidate phosphatase LPIN2 isoform X2 n=1 Tax=Latimeria chalumnae TaxID=7897 RepID=UPI0006D8EA24|nr:PREDICTED: phosphatidate phosphatase LPIN2-like isoform X2 [Latimeria chalumnae]|eukprot:XP_014342938.1 PREDICTED: phosphatidate phosphatase LPIN2-like isoform X2 [Latimeria chalumnae]
MSTRRKSVPPFKGYWRSKLRPHGKNLKDSEALQPGTLHPSIWSQTMNYVGQLAETVFVTVKELYKGLNPATLTGCIDVIVVRQPDSSFQCSPFHVRFGKLGVLRSKEKVVDIEINGEPVNLHMKLGDNGEAFFVQKTESDDWKFPPHLCTSPIAMEAQEHPAKTDSSNEGTSTLGSLSTPLKESEVTANTNSARKKRRRRKKQRIGSSKWEEQESSSDEQENLESDRTSEEKLKGIPTSSIYYSFTDATIEEPLTTHSREIYPYSDGDWPPTESEYLSRPSSPKSDSELLVKSYDVPHVGAESHMQWAWGRLPQVSITERSEQLKTFTITPSALTHFRAITGDDDMDSSPLDSASSLENTITVVRPEPWVQLESVVDPQNSVSEKQLDDTIVISDTKFDPSGPDTLIADTEQCLSEDPSEATPTHSQSPEGGGTEEPRGPSEFQEVLDTELAPKPEQVKVSETTVGKEMPASKQAATETETKAEIQEKRKVTLKRSQHLGPCDIYLDDLTKLEPKVAALYFPKSDVESGSKQGVEGGTLSRNQSPHSIGSGIIDSGTDYLSDSATDLPEATLSLCGGLGDNTEISEEMFMEHIILFQDFVKNPGIIDDPNLVIRIDKKYYNWAVAAPMILSFQAFQKNLPKGAIDKLVQEKMPKKSGRWWFSWRRKGMAAKSETKIESTEAAGPKQMAPSARHLDGHSSSEEEDKEVEGLVARTAKAKPELQSSDTTNVPFSPTYKKSLRLSSEDIKSLNLKDGPNDVVFSVTTQYQGTCRCQATIFLWNWDDKIIISDIDGTITKSDALGHILPQLGKDWTHQGIAKLYHKIHLNGYKFLYCSARAIGMADITKGYLQWVNDRGTVLPKGPVLLAPSSLFSALHREVIEKKPEVFKIACLTDIRNLFNPHREPFYAAFGNRTNDAYAYKEVGVKETRIFTVNPKGELIQERTKVNKSSYPRLSELVEHVFPLIKQGPGTAFIDPEYSHFLYWRDPLPSIHLEELNKL